MKKIILILFFASMFAQTQVETRTLNNGNLILEDVPNVPEEIKKELKGYQNIRSASFRGFKPDNEGVFISTRFGDVGQLHVCLLYTSPSPRDEQSSRMPSSA